jgi:indolepyruvate ferredoxin oxidoreductase beta subunit
MVPAGEADFLLVLEETQVEVNRHLLRPGGVLIGPETVKADSLPNRRSLNVALLGALSVHLDISQDDWLAALRANLPQRLHEANLQAFALGRAAGG